MLLKRDMPANGHVRQARRYRNRQYDNAVYRAMIGADLLLGVPLQPRGLLHAAKMVGSSAAYISAMKTLIAADAWTIIDAVLDGRVSLLDAANSMRKRTRLIEAYREATPGDLAAFVDAVGVNRVFDEAIAPALA